MKNMKIDANGTEIRVMGDVVNVYRVCEEKSVNVDLL